MLKSLHKIKSILFEHTNHMIGMLVNMFYVVCLFLNTALAPQIHGLRRVYDKSGMSVTGYLKKGDLVETPDGIKGVIWRVYVSISTNVPTGCAVIWEKPYKGELLSPFLPVEDYGTEYNPVLRKIEKP